MKTISVYKTVLKLQKGKIRLLPNCNRSHALPLDQQMAKYYTALQCFSLVLCCCHFQLHISNNSLGIMVATKLKEKNRISQLFFRRFCPLLYHCLRNLPTMLTSYLCSNPKNHRASCSYQRDSILH